MAQDNTSDADAYYGDDEINDEDLDLSFLDEDDEKSSDSNEDDKAQKA